jgi:hypothetical protein
MLRSKVAGGERAASGRDIHIKVPITQAVMVFAVLREA